MAQARSFPKIVETVVMLNPYPIVEGGAFPVKNIVDEPLPVWIDLFKDGHDLISASVLSRKTGAKTWQSSPLTPIGEDRWQGTLVFDEPGLWEYTFVAWPNAYASWVRTMRAKWDAQTDDLASETREGASLLERHAAVAKRARTASAKKAAADFLAAAELLRTRPHGELSEVIFSERLRTLTEEFPDQELATQFRQVLQVRVERKRAAFSAWYEFFPRSAEGASGVHNRFRDAVPRLEYAKDLGFDTVYFPPIHPIGLTHRKGKNNSLTALPDDVGSPWAIGGKEGGHKSILPELGSLEDFVWLVEQAKALDLEIALDIAFQCSPDHPYVEAHPDWFIQREDGTIRYAENPPKKYQDIYPIHFHGPDRQKLWEELTDVVLFWMDKGVRAFRVDNPHTKPVAFWQYLIQRAFEKDPGVIFLAEAFTKPKMMGVLGMVGFSQSYTYFTWRETRQELIDYVTELTKGEMRHYYRANFWPNTPDILPRHLQHAGEPSFRIRAALAALLVPSWGIYSGYEFCENDPYPGKEEYNNNEKYQLVDRDYTRPGIRAFIRELNRLRREHTAFQSYDTIDFVSCDNERILAFTRRAPDGSEFFLIAINLDPHGSQAGTVHFPAENSGLHPGESIIARDLMHGDSYHWTAGHGYVELHPHGRFLHVFRLERPGH